MFKSVLFSFALALAAASQAASQVMVSVDSVYDEVLLKARCNGGNSDTVQQTILNCLFRFEQPFDKRGHAVAYLLKSEKRLRAKMAEKDQRWTGVSLDAAVEDYGDQVLENWDLYFKPDNLSGTFTEAVIDSVLSQLSHRHGEIFDLMLWGYTGTEIAQGIRVSEPTVSRAIKDIRDLFAQELEQPHLVE